MNEPEKWEDCSFRLTMLVNDVFTQTDVYHPMASYIAKHLRGFELGEPLMGIAFIANENENGAIDFTLDDFKFMLNRINPR